MTTGKLAVLAGRHPLIVGVLGSLMALGVLAISLITLLASREAAVEHAHETSRNVTAVLVSNIARTIETSNNSLLALISALDKPVVQSMDPDLRHELLFDRTAAQYVTGMGVTDDQGRLDRRLLFQLPYMGFQRSGLFHCSSPVGECRALCVISLPGAVAARRAVNCDHEKDEPARRVIRRGSDCRY